MKILLTTYWTYPHLGGLSSYMSEMIHGLESLGHEVEIFAHTPDLQFFYAVRTKRYLKKQAVIGPVSERVLRFRSQYKYMASEWITTQEIDRYSFEAAGVLLGLTPYDLIHAQDVVSSRAISRVKPAQTPLVTTIHGCFTWEFQRAGIIKSEDEIKYSTVQERLGAESADRVIVPSEWLKNVLHKQFEVSLSKMNVVPYGVDVNKFTSRLNQPPEPQSFIADPQSFIILCPARLTAVKGHSYLINALAVLKKDYSHWECWFVGDGELREELEKQAEQLGLKQQVRFLGSRTDVPSLLGRADIVVLPSLQDNLPFVIIEAQLAGKAILSTDAGGIPEMIEQDRTGIIVPAASSEQLYAGLKRVMENPVLRRSLADEAGRLAPQQWSNELMLSRTLAIYEDLIKKGRCTR